MTQPATNTQQQTICQVILPLPPGINASYKIARIGHTHRLCATSELEAFKLQSRVALNRQRDKINWDYVQKIARSKQKIPLGMQITFFYPTLWLHDIDGGVKAVQDALFNHINEKLLVFNHDLKLNDNQIVDQHISKHANRENPHVEVKLWIVEEWE
jgi:Holliday junction resolvase RusA-like endonuclease